MGNIDRQIANRLLYLHRELLGGRADNYCRWYYDGNTDIYHCPHMALYGEDVVRGLPDPFAGTSQAQEDWGRNPESRSHPL